jgi:hypothetical protein
MLATLAAWLTTASESDIAACKEMLDREVVRLAVAHAETRVRAAVRALETPWAARIADTLTVSMCDDEGERWGHQGLTAKVGDVTLAFWRRWNDCGVTLTRGEETIEFEEDENTHGDEIWDTEWPRACAMLEVPNLVALHDVLAAMFAPIVHWPKTLELLWGGEE